MDDQKTNTFVVWIDESEVYRYVNFLNYAGLQCQCMKLTVYIYVFVLLFNDTYVFYCRSFYVDEVVSKMIGVEMSIATDTALALGSTESIVKSLYSVMKSQSMEGGQSNSTLASRYTVFAIFFSNCILLLGSLSKILYHCKMYTFNLFRSNLLKLAIN
jgi:hypothetical protein